MGRLTGVEHERREDSYEQPVAAQREPDFREEPARPVNEERPAHYDDEEPVHHENPDRSEAAEEYRDRERDEESGESGPPPDEHRSEGPTSEQGASNQGGGGQGRGRGRNRRGRRLSPRDRRMQDRNR